jgi:hypothetical protein
MKKIIKDFLERYCTIVVYDVESSEVSSYVELMMDNHFCIEYENIEYYVPVDNSLWGDDENLIRDILESLFSI